MAGLLLARVLKALASSLVPGGTRRGSHPRLAAILGATVLAAAAPTGCATTGDATSKFVGKSVADVVAAQGPYVTTFPREDGSRVFMWQRNVTQANDRYAWTISCNASAYATAPSPTATLDTWVIHGVTFEGKAC